MSTGPTTRRMGRVQAYLASHPAADFAPEFRPPRPATPRRKKDEQGGKLSPAEPFAFSVPEAARRLGIGKTLAWQLVWDRELGSIGVRGHDRVLVTPEDCRAWLASQERRVPDGEAARAG